MGINSANITKCRVCNSSNLRNVFDLGSQALTGVFIKNGSEVPSYNVSLSSCQSCGLTQINEVYDLDLLYGEGYGYESSLNSSMSEHLFNKSKKNSSLLGLNKNDIVIDIGSNDATTLSYFQDFNLKIGVDITAKKFRENYRKINAKVVEDFFPSSDLNDILKNRKAKLISSYSCFYDLPDPVAFAKAIKEILAEDGLWCLEQSYLPTMLKSNSLDTVCHEHIEYYKLTDILNICNRVNLEIKQVEFNDINGGSFSVLVGHKNNIHKVSKEVQKVINGEKKVNWIEEFQLFNDRINEQSKKTINLLKDLKKNGKKVYGIGASTKGNVLLQNYKIDSNLIEFIGEVNRNKFGCSTPGSNIKIVNENELLKLNPDYLFILPWHFKKFFVNNEKFKGFSLIFPLPKLEILEI